MAGIAGDEWRVEYDWSNDPQREAGPIELSRYLVNPVAPGGIPTFMRWPVCIMPEDLKAGREIFPMIRRLCAECNVDCLQSGRLSLRGGDTQC